MFNDMPAELILQPLIFAVVWFGGLLLYYLWARNRKRKKQLEQAGTTVYSSYTASPRASMPITPSSHHTFDYLLDDLVEVPRPANLVPVQPNPTNSMTRIPSEELSIMTNMTDSNSELTPEQMADLVEVMRIWRDMNDGSLIIQIGNQYYRRAVDIKNPDLLRRFVAVVRDLGSMVGQLPSRITGTYPIPDTNSAPNATSASLQALPPAPPTPAPVPANTAPRSGMLNRLSSALAPTRRDEPNLPEGGIVNSIEEFLQNRLSNTPEFVTRSIHIRPSFNHGVKIEVDDHSYDSISEVIDPDVRDFLVNLMKEWEARS